MTTREEIKAQSEWAIKYNRCCKALGGYNVVTCTEKIYAMIEELRKTKHALWLARAERARTESSNYCYSAVNAHTIHDYNTESKFEVKALRWIWAERKCREKAKEFE